MGVPTVTLVGQTLISRVGLSVLSRVGLEHLAALTPQEYVARALVLARNTKALAQIRSSLRRRMATSPLCDGDRFARELEVAYRQMWRAWCDGQIQKQETRNKKQESATPDSPPGTQNSELIRQGGTGR